jgi:hypothetical protein
VPAAYARGGFCWRLLDGAPWMGPSACDPIKGQIGERPHGAVVANLKGTSTAQARALLVPRRLAGTPNARRGRLKLKIQKLQTLPHAKY